MKITLRNNFHGTKIQMVTHQRPGKLDYLSKRQVRQAWRALCGFPYCECSDGLGVCGQCKTTNGVRVYYSLLKNGSADVWIDEPVQTKKGKKKNDDSR